MAYDIGTGLDVGLDVGIDMGIDMGLGTGAGHKLRCRFCHESVTHPNYGSALRICPCTNAKYYMSHRGCFYDHMLRHETPPVCPHCQHAWHIPPAEYMPFVYRKEEVRVWNLQRLSLRTLIAVVLFLAAAMVHAYVIKGLVNWASGSPVYVPFGIAVLTVYWHPTRGDLLVGSLSNAALFATAFVVRAIFRACTQRGCCGGYHPVGRRRGGGGDEGDEDEYENVYVDDGAGTGIYRGHPALQGDQAIELASLGLSSYGHGGVASDFSSSGSGSGSGSGSAEYGAVSDADLRRLYPGPHSRALMQSVADIQHMARTEVHSSGRRNSRRGGSSESSERSPSGESDRNGGSGGPLGVTLSADPEAVRRASETPLSDFSDCSDNEGDGAESRTE